MDEPRQGETLFCATDYQSSLQGTMLPPDPIPLRPGLLADTPSGSGFPSRRFTPQKLIIYQQEANP
jgi:hypothetical protein